MEFKKATMEDFDVAFDYIVKLWTYNTYDKEVIRKVYEEVIEDENAFAFFCMLTLSTLSGVLASRLYEYFAIVSIFLWTAAAYAFHPLNYGKIFINAVIFVQCLANVFVYTLGWYGNHMKRR